MKTKLISTLVAGLIVISPATYANYFKDDFSWGFDTRIWSARSGDNGSPFGCEFTPGMINPSQYGITLSLSEGACAELQSNHFYSFGKVQGSVKSGNIAGTVFQRSAFSHLRRSRNARLRWWAVCTGVKGIRKVCMLAWR